MTRIDHLLNYAKKELKITNFDQTDLGQTMLNFLEQSAKITDNDTESMKQLSNMLVLLIDQRPISPITEEDFEDEVHAEGDNIITIKRCTRYQYLYKAVDGKYYDDRAIAFRFTDSYESDRMYLYQSSRSSKQEVTLPYYPEFKVEIISRDFNIEPDYEVE
jgi:hypothetical protein